MRTPRLLPPAFIILLAMSCARDEEPARFQAVGSEPADLQTEVPRNAVISIRFRGNPDGATILGTDRIILVDQANSLVPVTITVQGPLVCLTPLSPLGQSATYGLAVRPGVRDIHGNEIHEPYEARFSTLPRSWRTDAY